MGVFWEDDWISFFFGPNTDEVVCFGRAVMCDFFCNVGPMNWLVGLMRVKSLAHNMQGFLVQHIVLFCLLCPLYSIPKRFFLLGFQLLLLLILFNPMERGRLKWESPTKTWHKFIYHMKWHPKAIRFHVILHYLLRRLWRSTNLYRAICMGCMDHSVLANWLEFLQENLVGWLMSLGIYII